MIDVVFSYEWLIDEEDGVSGIYFIIWSLDFGEGNFDVFNYVKWMLLFGMKWFLFVVIVLYEVKMFYLVINWLD